MNYQRIIIEVPVLPDEAAAYLHKFIDALMHAVDDQYYRQIYRYYANQLTDMMQDAQLTQEEDLDAPPF
jgi:predicted phosphoribosyltransferase